MIYIHQLNHFAPKTAEAEAVYLIRELKQKTPYPLNPDWVSAYFTDFLLSQTDKEAMQQAVDVIEPTIQQVQQLLQERSPVYEPINLQRTIAILKEMPPSLLQNIHYFESIIPWQEPYILALVPVLNGIPKASTMAEKKQWNDFLNLFFERILRTDQFAFNGQDIIHEGPLAQIVGLSESMSKGYFFHISLEEELKKVPIETFKRRLPSAEVLAADAVGENIEKIRKGVQRGYESNLRLLNWAVVIYAYVKWLSNPWEKVN